jgi:hypothetical protein
VLLSRFRGLCPDLERYLREVRALPDIGSVREPAGEWNPRSEGEARETEDNSDDNASMEDTESEEESKDTEGGGRYLRVQGELGPAGEWLLVAYHKPWQLLPPPFRNAFDDANEDQDESLLLDLQEHQSSLHGSSFNVA